MHCPHCNQEHPDNSRFCPLTGEPIFEPGQPNPQGRGITPTPAMPAEARRTKKRFPKIGWLLIAVLGGCCVLLSAVALVIAFWNRANQGETAVREMEGRIAFVSNRDGPSEIYVMNADGSNQTRLTMSDEKTHNDYPVWSPDGQKIAFVSDRGGNAEIYVMNADGSDQALLRDIPENGFYSSYLSEGDFRPVWSPDGQKIAFVSALEGDYKICIMGADGSNPACLPDSQVGGGVSGYFLSGSLLEENEDYPDYDKTGLSWSPDGQTILYSSSRSGTPKIYRINADGGDQSSLSNERYEYAPDYSPDGSKVAFVRGTEIYVMYTDGNAPATLISDEKVDSSSPSWSPDGRRIVFRAVLDGNSEICVINAGGGQQTCLTDNQAQNWNPDWAR